ncbi:MAG: YbaK/EbsC family protein [Motiliproteus sp.]
MSISTRVDAYLTAQNIDYETLKHANTNSSLGTSIAANITPDMIAKAVLLQDHEGRHLLAVLPADHKLNLQRLGDQLDLDLQLVSERQVYRTFADCAPGAVPAFGPAYNMNSIYDESLQGLKDIYLEAGDHKTLIHLTGEQFSQLMSKTQHSRFSERVLH